MGLISPSCQQAVAAETYLLLKGSGFDPPLALQFIEQEIAPLPFVHHEQTGSVSSLFKRNESVP